MKHDIPFKPIGKTFETRDQAKCWIIENQLSRRNLTPEQTAYLRGIRHDLEKDRHQNDADTGRTRERLAKEYGVSPATIRRDAQFAQAVDALPTEERAEVLAGKSGKTKAEIIAGEHHWCTKIHLYKPIVYYIIFLLIT
jgi:hypothetical protein